MTPWQFNLAMAAYGLRQEAEHDRAAWMMWHGAGIARSVEKMPPLSVFLSKQKNEVKGIDEAAIMTSLHNYQSQRENGNSSKS